jgi:small basic protein (TIGR04137 family)
MSIHPSLTSSEKDKKPRSVLKRIERIRTMIEKNQWKEGDRVCGLPKIKTIRIKIKKEKAAEKVEVVGAGAEGVGVTETKEKTEVAPKEKESAKGQEKK